MHPESQKNQVKKPSQEAVNKNRTVFGVEVPNQDLASEIEKKPALIASIQGVIDGFKSFGDGFASNEGKYNGSMKDFIKYLNTYQVNRNGKVKEYKLDNSKNWGVLIKDLTEVILRTGLAGTISLAAYDEAKNLPERSIHNQTITSELEQIVTVPTQTLYSKTREIVREGKKFVESDFGHSRSTSQNPAPAPKVEVEPVAETKIEKPITVLPFKDQIMVPGVDAPINSEQGQKQLEQKIIIELTKAGASPKYVDVSSASNAGWLLNEVKQTYQKDGKPLNPVALISIEESQNVDPRNIGETDRVLKTIISNGSKLSLDFVSADKIRGGSDSGQKYIIINQNILAPAGK